MDKMPVEAAKLCASSGEACRGVVHWLPCKIGTSGNILPSSGLSLKLRLRGEVLVDLGAHGQTMEACLAIVSTEATPVESQHPAEN